MVGFKVKFYWYQIGSGDFLHAFFSTVAYNLENMKWGSRFPRDYEKSCIKATYQKSM